MIHTKPTFDRKCNDRRSSSIGDHAERHRYNSDKHTQTDRHTHGHDRYIFHIHKSPPLASRHRRCPHQKCRIPHGTPSTINNNRQNETGNERHGKKKPHTHTHSISNDNDDDNGNTETANNHQPFWFSRSNSPRCQQPRFCSDDGRGHSGSSGSCRPWSWMGRDRGIDGGHRVIGGHIGCTEMAFTCRFAMTCASNCRSTGTGSPCSLTGTPAALRPAPRWASAGDCLCRILARGIALVFPYTETRPCWICSASGMRWPIRVGDREVVHRLPAGRWLAQCLRGSFSFWPRSGRRGRTFADRSPMPAGSTFRPGREMIG